MISVNINHKSYFLLFQVCEYDMTLPILIDQKKKNSKQRRAVFYNQKVGMMRWFPRKKLIHTI